MSRHLATILAATAIAACSSNPSSVEEPAAAAYPLVQYFPMPEPVPEPFEDALAPADPLVEAPPPLRAPDHVLPPRADTRRALADACDVIVKRWQDFTGKDAHLEDGRTFAELESKREKAA